MWSGSDRAQGLKKEAPPPACAKQTNLLVTFALVRSIIILGIL
jgi:hypothetical protein